MKFTKNFLFIFFISFACTACSKQGFHLKKIYSTHPHNQEWDISPLQTDERTCVLAALDQSYHYIGKGNHCYAFLSSDGQHVLKFFKQNHLGQHTWHNAIPLPSSLMSWYYKDYERRLKRRERDFTCYKNAYEALRKETGIFYLHLNRTHDLNKRVKISYKNKKEYWVNIDDFEFLLQDYVEVGFAPIAKLMECGKVDLALEHCRSMLELIATRCRKGFADDDIQIHKNFGFRMGQAYEIDLGYLQRDPSMCDPEKIKKEVFTVSQEIANWFFENYPQTLAEVERTIEDVISTIDRDRQLRRPSQSL